MSQVILATGGLDNTIRFWEATKNVCIKTIQHPESQVNKLEISSDKSRLVAAGNPFIRVYDLEKSTKGPLMQLDKHTTNVTAIQYSKDNHWLMSASEDGSLKMWDLREKKPSRDYRLKSQQAINTAVISYNDKEIYMGDNTGTISVLDLNMSKVSWEMVPQMGVPIRSICCNEHFLIGASDTGILYVYMISTTSGANQIAKTQYRPYIKVTAHPNHKILKCCISPDNGHMVTASSDKLVKIWSLDGIKSQGELKGHERWVWDCVYSIDGAYLVTVSSDSTARLWELQTKKEVKCYKGHTKALQCCALNDSSSADQ